MGEDDLDAALERIDRHGDVAPGDDPATISLLSRIEREFLAVRDFDSDRLVLTLTGRQRLTRRKAPPQPRGEVTPFRKPTQRVRKD